jgi:hypothetical protein
MMRPFQYEVEFCVKSQYMIDAQTSHFSREISGSHGGEYEV